MPFPMRIQPIEAMRRHDVVKPPPLLKSRLRRIFDRPINSVLRIEKQIIGGGTAPAAPEFEPSSVCLDKMVRNFIEDNDEKHSSSIAAAKYGRQRCNCFNGNSNSSDDDEFDFFSDSLAANSSFCETLKSLIPCASAAERNLLADTSRIVVEKNNNSSKTYRRKDDLRKIVTDGLIDLGYDASVCISKWEKSSAIPAGEYEYIDVIIEGERMIIDVDFRSEFEIARSTSSYRSILQCLPTIFVGKPDRLLQILSIASEAARRSLKKKGMHIAPWRKAEYTKSKWLSVHTRRIKQQQNSTSLTQNDAVEATPPESKCEPPEVMDVPESECGELDLIFGSSPLSESELEESESPMKDSDVPLMTWQLPEVRVKSLERGNKVVVVAGLASLLKEKL